MNTAIILPGKPSKKGYYDPKVKAQSNEHWIPWLQNQLLIRDILTQTPELPKPYAPNYEDWLAVFKQFKVDENTVLIGHSCGGGFLVRWLSDNNVKVKKVILVAPWLDPRDSLRNTFFKFVIDRHLLNRTKDGIVIFNSDNDADDIHESVKVIREANPDITYREFHEYGHFCFNDMRTEEFPELLAAATD